MNTPTFIPGQRWVSNTESEAGLGIVVEYQDRRVVISYPAINERRTYMANNAPLSRVRYSTGDRIRTSDGGALTVAEVREEGGYLTYIGTDADGNQVVVDEIDLDSFVQFSKPQDRLFAGQIDKLAKFELRQQTLAHLRRHQQSDTLGLQGARVQLLPHQLYIAAEVSSRYAPRVLLADEVGLGKTIEAGLILHQQLISGSAERVLIVVPDSLVHQWLVEMLRRFNLMFTILDEERCEALAESGGNPFESAQLVLCSLSLFVQKSKRHDQALAAEWDLMVVDEAHHLEWSEQQASPEYLCIEALARKVRGLLLLTATPEQLGVASHFARLRLLDPDRYYDLQTFCDEESGYQRVSEIVEKLQAKDTQLDLHSQVELQQDLQSHVGADVVKRLLVEVSSEEDRAQAIKKVIHSLLDRHGTGRVLFRNTREAVAGFPERQLNPHKLTTPESYLQAAKGAELNDLLHPERLLGADWVSKDPRVKWLTDWLAHNDEKALVICASAKTATALETHLNLRCGVRSAVFHEGMTLVQRDRAAAWFGDVDENAQALVCSEIGSEGRNFQFARHLVLFDLPLNPDLLEQRIGRLDRIGQEHTVQIHVPFYDTGAQFALLRWYHDGLGAFARVCPVGQNIFAQVREQLESCLHKNSAQTAESKAALEQLVEHTRNITEAALYKFRQGRDRLLELSSCDPDRAAQLIKSVERAEDPLQLAEYMEQVFNQFGVDQQHHSADAVILEPSDHLQCDSFPGLPEEGVTATFSREKALGREDMYFLSWEHPMVSGAMDMIVNGEFGNTAVCTLKLPPLKPGNLLLEAIYVLRCAAPQSAQLHRYLPLTTVRVVVGAGGRDLTNVLTPGHFRNFGKTVSRNVTQDVVRHARPQITELIQQAENLTRKQRDKEVEHAVARLRKSRQAELERLQALAQVNPNIRDEEMSHLARVTESLNTYLENAELRLDSIRVAVTV